MRFGLFSCDNEKGSSGMLPLMFSTVGGALFLFSFYNLTQFTAAKSAADQAARRVARCLTASDAAESCRSVLVDTEQTFSEAEWFGYPLVDGPSEVQLDTYQYQGQVYRDVYGASYNSYEVSTANHNVEWAEKSVRPSRFIGLLNSYAVLRADVRGNFERPLPGGGFETRSCTVYNRVEVPFGADFNLSTTYIDTAWCEGVNFRAEDPACADMDASWVPSTDFARAFPCHMVLPERATPEPWLLLGGSPVCHTDANDLATYGVPSEVGLSYTELDNHYRNFFGSGAVPGGVGRPFAVTNSRQFVVITVYSCNPEAFLSRVRSAIRNSDDLINYFTSYPSIDLPPFQSNQWGDFAANADPNYQNAFLYNSAGGMSYIASQDWTYLAWHRQTGNQWRSLTRKVCEWLPFDQARNTWEEFLPLGDPRNPFSHAPNPSGLDLMQLPELVFVDVPSCLSSEGVPLEQTRHMCGNMTIAGQPGSFSSCEGWNAKEAQRRSLFNQNLASVIAVNSNPSWTAFESLPTGGFVTVPLPRWSSVLSNGSRHFSWTADRFMGVPIVNPSAVQPRFGYNPKELSSEHYVRQYRKNEGFDGGDERRDLLLQAVIAQEGAGYGNIHEVPDVSLLFQENKIQEEIVPVEGVWPFIQDGMGGALPQPRPYVVSQFPFDYNLDCNPTSGCYSGGTPQFQNLDQALRFYANNAFGDVDLTNPEYIFDFTELRDRTITMPMSEVSSGAYPACTQFRSNCAASTNRGELISLGMYQSMPAICQSGEYVDCFPRYISSPETQQYTSQINHESARLLALAEVRRIMPGSVFCTDSISAGCVMVNIEEFGSEAKVDVSFIAPLTSPFTEILSADTITVNATKRELVEVERLKR